jgi:LCP family protein required for cell wall assembly
VTLASPIRFPDVKSREAMTRRAWWLVVLNLLMPGSVQVVAGNRRLGRVGLVSTFAMWAIAVLLGVGFLLSQSIVITVVANVVALTVLQIGLAYYVVLWIVLTLDTLRLVRLVRAAPRARPFVAGLAVVALVAVAGIAGYGAVVAGDARGLLSDVFGSGQMASPIDGKYNILLLGGDAGKGRTGLRPDSLSVVSIDAETGAATLIGIPRNLEFAPFPKGSPMLGPFPDGYDCGNNCLISYLYTYAEAHPELYPDAEKQGTDPGTEATRDAIEGVTGLTLQYYVLIDMSGFKDLIDALGGVDIDSTGRYPISGDIDANGVPINVKKWIEPGPQHMTGFTAMWYARSRHGTDDYSRMQRQRQVQEAILTQFSPGNVLTKFEGIAKAGKQIVKTDIPQGMLGGFVELAEKARSHKVTELELVPANGYHPSHPDFEKIHTDVQATLDAAAKAAQPKKN